MRDIDRISAVIDRAQPTQHTKVQRIARWVRHAAGDRRRDQLSTVFAAMRFGQAARQARDVIGATPTISARYGHSSKRERT